MDRALKTDRQIHREGSNNKYDAQIEKRYSTEESGRRERSSNPSERRSAEVSTLEDPACRSTTAKTAGIQAEVRGAAVQLQPSMPNNFTATRNNPILNVLPGSDPSLFGTERDNVHCAFYLKTGACRFGPACSKAHPYPISSPVVLFRNFYEPLYGTLKREVQLDEDEDDDLEIDETEAHNHFLEFYADTVPELRQFGDIVQLKVCRNHAPHLCGNVYVQYRGEEDALRALRSLNGRYYAGRAINAELSPVTHWKTAICGLFDKQQCPRGRQCNFLHVFRNPEGEYDLPRDTDRRDTDRRDTDRRNRSPREREHRARDRSRDDEHARDRHSHHDEREREHRRKRERDRSPQHDEHDEHARKKHKR